MQVQDVLAVCGGDLPDWCSELVVNYKFLFPFPLRQHYFHCTAFGMGRAVQHLQAMQAAEGAATPAADRETRELRLGRMSRQKVRPCNYPCACDPSLEAPGMLACLSICSDAA